MRSVSDGFNRNVLLSKYPFTDLNGDTRTGLDTWVQLATSYAPGGTPGIRGFIWCEIDLPATDYAGNVVVDVLHTPGHTPGHLALFDPVSGTVVAGDLVSGLSTIVIDPPEGLLDL